MYSQKMIFPSLHTVENHQDFVVHVTGGFDHGSWLMLSDVSCLRGPMAWTATFPLSSHLWGLLSSRRGSHQWGMKRTVFLGVYIYIYMHISFFDLPPTQ